MRVPWPASVPPPRCRPSRRDLLAGALATLGVAGVPGRAFGQRPGLKLALPGRNANLLPVYLAAERTFREEGLQVDLLTFDGDPAVAQALASRSVDVAIMTLSAVINMIGAGQEVRAFYNTVYWPDYEWFARREITAWGQLRGKTVAVTAQGGFTDLVTRHVLRRQGLTPGRDVHLVSGGGAPARLAALRAGRVDAAILQAPFKWEAEAQGFSRLGSQASEVGEAWPTGFVAALRWLDDHPGPARAMLRAYVKAVRLARADPDTAVQALMKTLRYERKYAERAYDEIQQARTEGGPLPAKVMPTFWEIAVAAGEVPAPWPESRLFDRRFVDTLDEWAPR